MATKPAPIMLLQAAPYVVIEQFSAITGYSIKAVERKIEDGVWVEGREWRRAPDGRRLISIQGYQRWVERARG